jgi:hypothetical protein
MSRRVIEKKEKYHMDVLSLSNDNLKQLLSCVDGDGYIDNKTKLSCSSACRGLASQIYYCL